MNNRYLSICYLVLLLAWIGGIGSGPVYAADATEDTLRGEVDALKQIVQHLEQRLSDLEKRIPAPSAAQPDDADGAVGKHAPANRTGGQTAAASKASASVETDPLTVPEGQNPSIRDLWRQITRRMTAGQIEALLGRPEKKFTSGDKTVWYYRYANNRRGSVTFFKDMHVAGWQTPP